MSTCKVCGQEIIQEDFEGQEELETCTDCIISSSRKYGTKQVSLLCFLTIDSVFFIITLLTLISITPGFLPEILQNPIYFFHPIATLIISGVVLVIYFSVLINKASHRQK